MLLENICFVTSSMGRLAHIKKSLPFIISQPFSKTVVVDYSCPDKTGNWVKENYPECSVVKVPGEKYFCLTKARNAAIPEINKLDCEWLCFVDADTIVSENFVEKIQKLLEESTFITGYNIYNKVKGLGGLLIVSKKDFLKVDGYDEAITGYGTNASEMRLRLYFNDVSYKILPEGMAHHIDHSYSETFSKYREDNQISLYENTKVLLKKIKRWEAETGKKVPRELYKKDQIRWIESELPVERYPFIKLKVLARKIFTKFRLMFAG